MLPALAVLGAVVLAVYCVIDVATTSDADVRGLPRLGWLLVVAVVPVLGGLAWLRLGRARGRGRGGEGGGGSGRGGPPRTPRAPDDDDDFLRGLRDEQRRRADRERRDGEAQAPGSP